MGLRDIAEDFNQSRKERKQIREILDPNNDKFY